mmetsp:Transcript_7726/g.16684  ORF Transcript_7726/g.16684 Transcript_7726/m.16684 type:complete len:364 (+) Transcript_7726:853-1944(+)
MASSPAAALPLPRLPWRRRWCFFRRRRTLSSSSSSSFPEALPRKWRRAQSLSMLLASSSFSLDDVASCWEERNSVRDDDWLCRLDAVALGTFKSSSSEPFPSREDPSCFSFDSLPLPERDLEPCLETTERDLDLDRDLDRDLACPSSARQRELEREREREPPEASLSLVVLLPWTLSSTSRFSSSSLSLSPWTVSPLRQLVLAGGFELSMAVAVAVAETGTNNRLAGDASLVESRLVTVLTEMVPLRSFVYDVALAGAVTAVVEVVSGRVSSVRLHVACSDPDRDRDRDRGEDLEGTLSRFFSGKGFFFSSPATSLFFFVSRSFLSALSVPFFCVSEDCSRRCDCSSFSFNLLDSMDNSSREA